MPPHTGNAYTRLERRLSDNKESHDHQGDGIRNLARSSLGGSDGR